MARTTVTLDVSGENFQAKGNTIRNEGWKRVYKDADEECESTLPPFEKDQVIELKGITLTEGKTKPPAFFNEGTLLGAMENPAQFMAGESKALIQTLGETGGLGTVATRADIIDKLFNSFLIEKKGKDLTITSKGRQLLELVPEDLKSPKLTADWETQLTKIAKGQLKKEQFMKEMVAFSKKSVAEIKSSDKKFKHDIDVVVDRIVVKEGLETRLADSLRTALDLATPTAEYRVEPDASFGPLADPTT